MRLKPSRNSRATAITLPACSGAGDRWFAERLASTPSHEWIRDADPLPRPWDLRGSMNFGHSGWALRFFDPALQAIVDGGFNEGHPNNNGVVIHGPGLHVDEATAAKFTPQANREREPGSMVELGAATVLDG